MVEPVNPGDFPLVFWSAAGVILLGGAYALLFALAHIRNLPVLLPFAYAAYAGLCLAVFGLGYGANLYSEGIWIALVIVMLVGYLIAPHAALRLCRATHVQDDTRSAPYRNNP